MSNLWNIYNKFDSFNKIFYREYFFSIFLIIGLSSLESDIQFLYEYTSIIIAGFLVLTIEVLIPYIKIRTTRMSLLEKTKFKYKMKSHIIRIVILVLLIIVLKNILFYFSTMKISNELLEVQIYIGFIIQYRNIIILLVLLVVLIREHYLWYREKYYFSWFIELNNDKTFTRILSKSSKTIVFKIEFQNLDYYHLFLERENFISRLNVSDELIYYEISYKIYNTISYFHKTLEKLVTKVENREKRISKYLSRNKSNKGKCDKVIMEINELKNFCDEIKQILINIDEELIDS